jgi:acetamidase/formamidase
VASTPSTHITRDRFHLTWDPAIAPIETVASGSIVTFDLLDASGGQLTAESQLADLVALDFSRVDQVNGPIAVEGAEPGDTLQVDLLDFQPADWGWTASIPGFGLLTDDFPDPVLRITRIPAGGPAEFLPGIRVPVVPFCGEVGVAPATGPRSTIPPDLHGGNMDTRHLTAGATLFLPVFQAGARLSIGDGHAAQGDGEVCGTAIETPMRATARLTARPDLHLSGP